MEIAAALVFSKTLLINVLLNMIAHLCAIIVVRRYTLLHLIYELSMHIIGVPNFVEVLRILWFEQILLVLKVESFQFVGR